MEKLTDEIRKKLNAPLPKEAVAQHPTKKFLSTIKAIYVVERLNDVFGIGKWFIKYNIIETGDKWIVAKGILTVPEYGIEVEQYGGNDNADRGDAFKGACTDCLTKIGSYLEIGIDVFKGLADSPPDDKKAVKKDNERPWMTDRVYKQVIAKIQTGDFRVRDNVEPLADVEELINYLGTKYRISNEYKTAMREEAESTFNAVMNSQ